jgi:signal-transduction protein with cAMP-binding, CBS, and nucleotidyltransferase domain
MKETVFPQDKSAITEKLHKLLFPTQLSVEQMSLLLNISRLRQFEEEETIYKEGSKNQWVYFLISGSVSILEDLEEVAEHEHPGSLLGENILAGKLPHKRSAIANKTTVCLAVEADLSKHLTSPEATAGCAVLYHITSRIAARHADEMEKELRIVQHELDIVKSNMWNSK